MCDDYDLMAQDLERLLNEFLDGTHEKPTGLKEFLWDHKVGILRALQKAAAYIDRYDYGKGGVTYVEPPAFITGAERYVPAAEIERLRAALTNIAGFGDVNLAGEWEPAPA